MRNKSPFMLCVTTVLAITSGAVNAAASTAIPVGSWATFTKTGTGTATVTDSTGSTQNVVMPAGFSLPNAQTHITAGQSATITKTAEGAASVKNFQGQSSVGTVNVNVNGVQKATISTGNASGTIDMSGGKTSGSVTGKLTGTKGGAYDGKTSYGMKGTTVNADHTGVGTNSAHQTVYSGHTNGNAKVGLNGVSGSVTYSGTANHNGTSTKTFSSSSQHNSGAARARARSR